MKFLPALGLVLMMQLASPQAMAEDKDDKNKSDQNFVYLKPLMLPVMANGNIDQFVSVTVTLEFDDSASADKAHAMVPRIVDAYLQDLYGAMDNQKVMRGGVLDPMALKAELESSNTRVLGAVPCKVLLQNIGQRTVHETTASAL